MNLGISGYAFVGTDIGGFIGSPPADLLTRWIEVGVFNPIYRDHTAKGTADQEPWASGPEQEAIRKRYIELRYRLLPYLYTTVEETTRTGLPMMRPLFLEYPLAVEFYEDERDFMFGNDFLVEPVMTEMTDALDVRLPPGEWYEFWSSKQVTAKDGISLKAKLEEMLVFVRAGAIVPMQAVTQFTGERPVGPLELRVYAGSDCHGTLYQDDGHSYGYQRGEFLRVTYTCDVEAHAISVTSHVEKKGYAGWWKDTELKVYGIASAPTEVRVRDRVVENWKFDEGEHCVKLIVKDAVGDWVVTVVEK